MIRIHAVEKKVRRTARAVSRFLRVQHRRIISSFLVVTFTLSMTGVPTLVEAWPWDGLVRAIVNVFRPVLPAPKPPQPFYFSSGGGNSVKRSAPRVTSFNVKNYSSFSLKTQSQQIQLFQPIVPVQSQPKAPSTAPATQSFNLASLFCSPVKGSGGTSYNFLAGFNTGNSANNTKIASLPGLINLPKAGNTTSLPGQTSLFSLPGAKLPAQGGAAPQQQQSNAAAKMMVQNAQANGFNLGGLPQLNGGNPLFSFNSGKTSPLITSNSIFNSQAALPTTKLNFSIQTLIPSSSNQEGPQALVASKFMSTLSFNIFGQPSGATQMSSNDTDKLKSAGLSDSQIKNLPKDTMVFKDQNGTFFVGTQEQIQKGNYQTIGTNTFGDASNNQKIGYTASYENGVLKTVSLSNGQVLSNIKTDSAGKVASFTMTKTEGNVTVTADYQNGTCQGYTRTINTDSGKPVVMQYNNEGKLQKINDVDVSKGVQQNASQLAKTVPGFQMTDNGGFQMTINGKTQVFSTEGHPMQSGGSGSGSGSTPPIVAEFDVTQSITLEVAQYGGPSVSVKTEQRSHNIVTETTNDEGKKVHTTTQSDVTGAVQVIKTDVENPKSTGGWETVSISASKEYIQSAPSQIRDIFVQNQNGPAAQKIKADDSGMYTFNVDTNDKNESTFWLTGKTECGGTITMAKVDDQVMTRMSGNVEQLATMSNQSASQIQDWIKNAQSNGMTVQQEGQSAGTYSLTSVFDEQGKQVMVKTDDSGKPVTDASGNFVLAKDGDKSQALYGLQCKMKVKGTQVPVIDANGNPVMENGKQKTETLVMDVVMTKGACSMSYTDGAGKQHTFGTANGVTSFLKFDVSGSALKVKNTGTGDVTTYDMSNNFQIKALDNEQYGIHKTYNSEGAETTSWTARMINVCGGAEQQIAPAMNDFKNSSSTLEWLQSGVAVVSNAFLGAMNVVCSPITESLHYAADTWIRNSGDDIGNIYKTIINSNPVLNALGLKVTDEQAKTAGDWTAATLYGTTKLVANNFVIIALLAVTAATGGATIPVLFGQAMMVASFTAGLNKGVVEGLKEGLTGFFVQPFLEVAKGIGELAGYNVDISLEKGITWTEMSQDEIAQVKGDPFKVADSMVKVVGGLIGIYFAFTMAKQAKDITTSFASNVLSPIAHNAGVKILPKLLLRGQETNITPEIRAKAETIMSSNKNIVSKAAEMRTLAKEAASAPEAAKITSIDLVDTKAINDASVKKIADNLNSASSTFETTSKISDLFTSGDAVKMQTAKLGEALGKAGDLQQAATTIASITSTETAGKVLAEAGKADSGMITKICDTGKVSETVQAEAGKIIAKSPVDVVSFLKQAAETGKLPESVVKGVFESGKLSSKLMGEIGKSREAVDALVRGADKLGDAFSAMVKGALDYQAGKNLGVRDGIVNKLPGVSSRPLQQLLLSAAAEGKLGKVAESIASGKVESNGVMKAASVTPELSRALNQEIAKTENGAASLLEGASSSKISSMISDMLGDKVASEKMLDALDSKMNSPAVRDAVSKNAGDTLRMIGSTEQSGSHAKVMDAIAKSLDSPTGQKLSELSSAFREMKQSQVRDFISRLTFETSAGKSEAMQGDLKPGDFQQSGGKTAAEGTGALEGQRAGTTDAGLQKTLAQIKADLNAKNSMSKKAGYEDIEHFVGELEMAAKGEVKSGGKKGGKEDANQAETAQTNEPQFRQARFSDTLAKAVAHPLDTIIEVTKWASGWGLMEAEIGRITQLAHTGEVQSQPAEGAMGKAGLWTGRVLRAMTGTMALEFAVGKVGQRIAAKKMTLEYSQKQVERSKSELEKLIAEDSGVRQPGMIPETLTKAAGKINGALDKIIPNREFKRDLSRLQKMADLRQTIETHGTRIGNNWETLALEGVNQADAYKNIASNLPREFLKNTRAGMKIEAKYDKVLAKEKTLQEKTDQINDAEGSQEQTAKNEAGIAALETIRSSQELKQAIDSLVRETGSDVLAEQTIKNSIDKLVELSQNEKRFGLNKSQRESVEKQILNTAKVFNKSGLAVEALAKLDGEVPGELMGKLLDGVSGKERVRVMRELKNRDLVEEAVLSMSGESRQDLAQRAPKLAKQLSDMLETKKISREREMSLEDSASNARADFLQGLPEGERTAYLEEIAAGGEKNAKTALDIAGRTELGIQRQLSGRLKLETVKKLAESVLQDVQKAGAETEAKRQAYDEAVRNNKKVKNEETMQALEQAKKELDQARLQEAAAGRTAANLMEGVNFTDLKSMLANDGLRQIAETSGSKWLKDTARTVNEAGQLSRLKTAMDKPLQTKELIEKQLDQFNKSERYAELAQKAALELNQRLEAGTAERELLVSKMSELEKTYERQDLSFKDLVSQGLKGKSGIEKAFGKYLETQKSGSVKDALDRFNEEGKAEGRKPLELNEKAQTEIAKQGLDRIIEAKADKVKASDALLQAKQRVETLNGRIEQLPQGGNVLQRARTAAERLNLQTQQRWAEFKLGRLEQSNRNVAKILENTLKTIDVTKVLKADGELDIAIELKSMADPKSFMDLKQFAEKSNIKIAGEKPAENFKSLLEEFNKEQKSENRIDEESVKNGFKRLSEEMEGNAKAENEVNIADLVDVLFSKKNSGLDAAYEKVLESNDITTAPFEKGGAWETYYKEVYDKAAEDGRLENYLERSEKFQNDLQSELKLGEMKTSAEMYKVFQEVRQKMIKEGEIKAGSAEDAMLIRKYSELVFQRITGYPSLRFSQKMMLNEFFGGRNVGLRAGGGKTIPFIFFPGMTNLLQGKAKAMRAEILVDDPAAISKYINEAFDTGLVHQDLAKAFGIELVNGNEVYAKGQKTGDYGELIDALTSPDKVVIFDHTTRGHLRNAEVSNKGLRDALAETNLVGIDEVHMAATSQTSAIIGGDISKPKTALVQEVDGIMDLFGFPSSQWKGTVESFIKNKEVMLDNGFRVLDLRGKIVPDAKLSEYNQQSERLLLITEEGVSANLAAKEALKGFEGGNVQSVLRTLLSMPGKAGEMNAYSVTKIKGEDGRIQEVISPVDHLGAIQKDQISNDIAGQITAARINGLDVYKAVRVNKTTMQTSLSAMYAGNNGALIVGASGTIAGIENLMQSKIGSGSTHISTSILDIQKMIFDTKGEVLVDAELGDIKVINSLKSGRNVLAAEFDPIMQQKRAAEYLKAENGAEVVSVFGAEGAGYYVKGGRGTDLMLKLRTLASKTAGETVQIRAVDAQGREVKLDQNGNLAPENTNAKIVELQRVTDKGNGKSETSTICKLEEGVKLNGLETDYVRYESTSEGIQSIVENANNKNAAVMGKQVVVFNEQGAVGKNFQDNFTLVAFDAHKLSADMLTQLLLRSGRPDGKGSSWDTTRHLVIDPKELLATLESATSRYEEVGKFWKETAGRIEKFDSLTTISGKDGKTVKGDWVETIKSLTELAKQPKANKAEIENIFKTKEFVNNALEVNSEYRQLELIGDSTRFAVQDTFRDRMVIDPLKKAMRDVSQGGAGYEVLNKALERVLDNKSNEADLSIREKSGAGADELNSRYVDNNFGTNAREAKSTWWRVLGETIISPRAWRSGNLRTALGQLHELYTTESVLKSGKVELGQKPFFLDGVVRPLVNVVDRVLGKNIDMKSVNAPKTFADAHSFLELYKVGESLMKDILSKDTGGAETADLKYRTSTIQNAVKSGETVSAENMKSFRESWKSNHERLVRAAKAGNKSLADMTVAEAAKVLGTQKDPDTTKVALAPTYEQALRFVQAGTLSAAKKDAQFNPAAAQKNSADTQRPAYLDLGVGRAGKILRAMPLLGSWLDQQTLRQVNAQQGWSRYQDIAGVLYNVDQVIQNRDDSKGALTSEKFAELVLNNGGQELAQQYLGLLPQVQALYEKYGEAWYQAGQVSLGGADYEFYRKINEPRSSRLQQYAVWRQPAQARQQYREIENTLQKLAPYFDRYQDKNADETLYIGALGVSLKKAEFAEYLTMLNQAQLDMMKRYGWNEKTVSAINREALADMIVNPLRSLVTGIQERPALAGGLAAVGIVALTAVMPHVGLVAALGAVKLGGFPLAGMLIPAAGGGVFQLLSKKLSKWNEMKSGAGERLTDLDQGGESKAAGGQKLAKTLEQRVKTEAEKAAEDKTEFDRDQTAKDVLAELLGKENLWNGNSIALEVDSKAADYSKMLLLAEVLDLFQGVTGVEQLSAIAIGGKLAGSGFRLDSRDAGFLSGNQYAEKVIRNISRILSEKAQFSPEELAAIKGLPLLQGEGITNDALLAEKFIEAYVTEGGQLKQAADQDALVGKAYRTVSEIFGGKEFTQKNLAGVSKAVEQMERDGGNLIQTEFQNLERTKTQQAEYGFMREAFRERFGITVEEYQSMTRTPLGLKLVRLLLKAEPVAKMFLKTDAAGLKKDPWNISLKAGLQLAGMGVGFVAMSVFSGGLLLPVMAAAGVAVAGSGLLVLAQRDAIAWKLNPGGFVTDKLASGRFAPEVGKALLDRSAFRSALNRLGINEGLVSESHQALAAKEALAVMAGVMKEQSIPNADKVKQVREIVSVLKLLKVDVGVKFTEYSSVSELKAELTLGGQADKLMQHPGFRNAIAVLQQSNIAVNNAAPERRKHQKGSDNAA